MGAQPTVGKNSNMERPANVNPAQWAAVTHPSSRLLITAGPGTGKTHTLTWRIAHRLKALPSGKKILAVTFTHKAAREMQERLQQMVPFMGDSLSVGTFHSFCLSLLQKYWVAAGLPENFRVATPDEIDAIAKQLWPDSNGKARGDRLGAISNFKSRDSWDAPSEEVVSYGAALRAQGLLDFDDLIVETICLFEKNESFCRDLQTTWQDIFVDEYQDINPAQRQLLKLLVGENGGITAIGDPNQAIYGFRGSDVSFFVSFVDDFPGACQLSLTENYRSASNLLSASSQVMAGSSYAVPPLVARLYQEGQLIIHDAPTDKAEAEYVVHAIEKIVGGVSMFSHDSGRVKKEEEAHFGFGDIAVLFRLHHQARLLKEAFDRSGIPYAVAEKKSALESDDDDVDSLCPSRNEEFPFAADKVALMTLHAAKGLEFPVVFIVGCEEKLLPLALDAMNADPEEERRLFYVGMTRAQVRLYLLHAQRRCLYGKRHELLPSPYLADIQEELKKYELASPIKRRRKEDDQLSLF